MLRQLRNALRKSPNVLPPLAIATALLVGSAFAENVDPSNSGAQYAYGANVGWINAEPNGDGGQGVQVSGMSVTGWLYGANVGWISLNCANPEDAMTCGANPYGVTNDGLGNLSGYAYGANIGWISFSCNNVPVSCASTGNYGVTVSPTTGQFAGKAYSANAGWINFEFTTSGASRITVAPDTDAFAQLAQTLHRGPANADAARDNCMFDTNPSQLNTDGNFLDNSPPYSTSVDDKTLADSDAPGDACDLDADNDGISDVNEVSGASCGAVATDPLLRDTDADRFLDSAECALGTNPTVFASKPAVTACGATTDADGDKLSERVEFCFYGTDPANSDSDGDKALDGAKDGCEAASFNGDRIVNVADMGMLASAISNVTFRIPNVDVNKDGVWNPADQGLVASFISPGGQCPG